MSVEKRKFENELHAPARRNFPRRRVVVHDLWRDDLWQADVVEMRPYARFNKGYNYILTVIDVLSKYAWALPLKSKRRKRRSRSVIQNISRGRTIPTKPADRSRKGILQHYRAEKNCEKIQHKSLFDVFGDESIGSGTIQSYTQE